MNVTFRDEVFRAGFKPTFEAEQFEARLRSKLGLTAKYMSGQLAIGRSLAEPSSPAPLPQSAKRGIPIPGELLFRPHLDLWIAAIVLDGQFGSNASVEDFRAQVEAHWARGATLLQAELEERDGDETRMMEWLANLLPEVGVPATHPGQPSPARPGSEVRLHVGPVSRTYPDGVSVDFVLNGQATSPNIALMGRAGTGKTMTGVQFVQQIVDQAHIPFLFIDPKGEFVSDQGLRAPLDQIHPAPIAVEVGLSPVPLDFLPDSGVGTTGVAQAAMQFRDSIALCCQRVGDIQRDCLRTAAEEVIRQEPVRTLQTIRDHYEHVLAQRTNRQTDSVVSRLNELTSLQVFSPEQRPSEFFSRSWVLSFKQLPEELKRLSILLVLDSLKSFVLTQADSHVEGAFRTLRHVLVIDEARRILAQERYHSLVDLIRQGRSKGQVVLLLSQDPSDFEGKADDFMTQLSTVVAFACAQTHRGLRALQGPFGRKLQPKEFTDTELRPGIALVKLPGVHTQKIHCWSAIEA